MIPYEQWTNETVRDLGIVPQWWYLMEFFEAMDYHRPLVAPHRVNDIRRPDNVVGHWQRCVNITWAIKQCYLTGGVGLEFGSAGVHTPWCLNTDVRTGLPSHYPPDVSVKDRSIVQGHMRVSADDPKDSFIRHDAVCADDELVYGTKAFRDNAFSLIVANHVLEHTKGDPVELLTEWVRILSPGGVIALVIPDNNWFDVMKCDPDHQHAWTSLEFLNIAERVPGVEVVEHTGEIQPNYHSFATILRKK